MTIRWAACLVVLLALAHARPAATAQDAPIEAFYGTYVGTSISSTEQGLRKRDLGVSIDPRNKGFNITWTTVATKSNGKSKRKTYSIDFEPTRNPNIFASAMQKNMFGKRVPLNPLKGDPYIWARIRGRTLTVFALQITRDGGYEMQVYERTLTEDGLHLEFSRIRDGTHMKFVTGQLDKVEN